jgi:hypothetical protein
MTLLRHARSSRRSATIILALFMMAAFVPLRAQVAQDTSTDLKFHKFQPKVSPEQAVPAGANQLPGPAGMSMYAAQQIQALEQEKESRTPAQRKIDSNVLYTIRMLRGEPAAPGAPYLYTGVDLDENDNVVVDITARVTDQLLQQLNSTGALVLYSNADLRSIRAIVPPSQIENIAASPDVIFISPKQESMTRRVERVSLSNASLRWRVAPGFEQRMLRVRRKLAALLQSSGTPFTGQGSVTTEGDLTHRAFDARGTFGINGSPLKIGVLSNGVVSLAQSQATGDLPPTCGTPPCVTVLPGQTGAGDEGTAMMEIIYDMAPGASLYFATANNGTASFAANIRALRTAGCDIILDDVFYFVESPFQDGQTVAVVSNTNGGVVTQAVNDVVAAGALYFSSAGNEGNLDDATSGTYEGDFNGVASSAPLPLTGKVHNFGATLYDSITSPGAGINFIGLWWADPLGGSGNDYDLYVLNNISTMIVSASTNIQSGTQDPFEFISGAAVATGNRVVVFQKTGAANRFFHIGNLRGTLAVATAGETHGHSAASGAYTVAATPAAGAFGPGYPTGPFPNPFNASNAVELFTSDGLRHIFFHGDGTLTGTAGDFSSTGGSVLNKPDITAADGVSVTGVGGFGSPFYGTSAAAPSAAAVASLVKSAKPSLTQAQIRTALTSTAIDIMGAGFDRDSGSGIVMAYEAVSSLGVPGTANPELGTITATENPGNGNGVIEAGEGAKLVIQLKNTSGVANATGITAVLTTSTAGVTITQPNTSAYANLTAGSGTGNNLSPFTFTLASNATCGLVINFTLTVTYTGGPQRVLNFNVPTGMITFNNNLGTTPTTIAGVTPLTGTQTGRLTRTGVPSACASVKAFPGIFTNASRAFDSYTFTACQATCVSAKVTSANAANLFEVAYSPSFDPANIATNYAGDAGSSSNGQTCAINTVASTAYTFVVHDVPGTSVGTNYDLQLPVCAFNCTVNQVPVAVVHNVTVVAATVGGTANASINNGSFDPDGDTITLTQSPAGPYPGGTTNVMLTVVDTKGATAQASATVTVINTPDFTLPPMLNPTSQMVNAGQSANYTLAVGQILGFSSSVSFTCSLPAAATTCMANPASQTPGNSVTITATTTVRTLLPPPIGRRLPRYFLPVLLLAMALLFARLLHLAGSRRRRLAVALPFGVLILLVVYQAAGCGGGSSTPVVIHGGTQPGTYTITVTGTSGASSHTSTGTLVVN